MLMKPPKGAMLNRGDPLARGIVGCWLMNEGTGNKICNLSGSYRPFALTGTSWTADKFGPTLNFNGSSDIADAAAISAGGFKGLTIGAWVKAATSPLTNSGTIFKQGSSGGSYLFNTYLHTNKYVYTYFYRDGGTSGLVWKANGIVDSLWHLVVATWDLNNALVYVDGVPGNPVVFAGTPEDGISAGQDQLSIGASRSFAGATSIWFDGKIDAPMLYNRALSATEIQQLYMTPFRMFRREPIELWTGAYAPTAEDINIYVYDTE